LDRNDDRSGAFRGGICSGKRLELPQEHRSAFLEQACRGAPELRRLVEQLLAKDRQSGSFPASHAFTLEATAALSAANSPEARFQPAQLISDRFLIVRFIARGGMGEVYEARDQLLQGASVALKIIRPEIAADAATSVRFQQEVVLAAQGGSFQPLSHLRDLSL
jgi:eukaryotic-like serine/threonine-protein kinase